MTSLSSPSRYFLSTSTYSSIMNKQTDDVGAITTSKLWFQVYTRIHDHNNWIEQTFLGGFYFCCCVQKTLDWNNCVSLTTMCRSFNSLSISFVFATYDTKCMKIFFFCMFQQENEMKKKESQIPFESRMFNLERNRRWFEYENDLICVATAWTLITNHD